ncbi:MAG TPA: homoserine kinase [Segeticoccus sp.]|uniref:homoserine kinase n=1 Tax=Segeticoccus sp. TaxID=2706531 RepID=UPI002D7EF60B|nr:homoserine kinase [Segeticoccus sp.]HET8599532.1 homoserine kinase [Segeticoccus sp.]
MPHLSTGLGVRVRVPASSANLGPGFDSVGLALGIHDECEVRLEGERICVQVEGEGAGVLPEDHEHLILRAMSHTWAHLGVTPPAGISVVCRNRIPQSRGLGSSAAAIVTGVVAAQALAALAAAGDRRPREGRVEVDRCQARDLASDMEGHPDNASASVFGGMTLSWPGDGPGQWCTAPLTVHPDVAVTVLVPSAALATSTARAVLPELVAHTDAARNSARAALLVEAIGHRPELLLAATMEWLHQEARRAAFPASMALVDRLREHGCAAVISGAGPSVLVLGTHEEALVIPQVLAGLPLAGGASDWQVLRPGVADTGATVTVSLSPSA